MAFPQAVPSEQRNGRADAGRLCAYCHKERAVNRDHVVPKSLRKTHNTNYRVSSARRESRTPVPAELLRTVPSCFACNIRKGSRRLVPPSWAKHIARLDELFPGTPWRVWHGGLDEPAYREAWT